MASLMQGDPLPNITTTQQQNTTAPSWYNNYISNLAKQSTNAAANAQYVGAQPLQNQAFTNVAANVGNYQPDLNNANAAAGNAGQNAYDVVGNYMSPYTQNVVNQIGALGQTNINRNLAPQATAGAVGSGQFGSKRGAEVLGQTINDANQNILTTQGQALNTGYQNAMGQAQNDLQRQLGVSQQYGNLANQTQAQGLADVNALATLGGQQQTIKQNAQLFPLQTLNMSSQNMKGFTVPTNVSSKYNGPIPGAYAASPLSQIAGLGSIIAGASDTPFGKAIGSALTDWFKTQKPEDLSKMFYGNTIDASGNVVTPNGGNGTVVNNDNYSGANWDNSNNDVVNIDNYAGANFDNQP
jgi:hypothetical protein